MWKEILSQFDRRFWCDSTVLLAFYVIILLISPIIIFVYAIYKVVEFIYSMRVCCMKIEPNEDFDLPVIRDTLEDSPGGTLEDSPGGTPEGTQEDLMATLADHQILAESMTSMNLSLPEDINNPLEDENYSLLDIEEPEPKESPSDPLTSSEENV